MRRRPVPASRLFPRGFTTGCVGERLAVLQSLSAEAKKMGGSTMRAFRSVLAAVFFSRRRACHCPADRGRSEFQGVQGRFARPGHEERRHLRGSVRARPIPRSIRRPTRPRGSMLRSTRPRSTGSASKTIKYEVAPFGQLIPMMISKRIDVVASNIHQTPDRLKVVTFTTPAWWYGPAIVTQKGNPKGIKSFDDLKGKQGRRHRRIGGGRISPQARRRGDAFPGGCGGILGHLLGQGRCHPRGRREGDRLS